MRRYNAVRQNSGWEFQADFFCCGLTSSRFCWPVWDNVTSARSGLLARHRSQYVCTTEYERPQWVQKATFAAASTALKGTDESLGSPLSLYVRAFIDGVERM